LPQSVIDEINGGLGVRIAYGQLLPMLERKLTVATQASLATMNFWVASVHLRLT
jgi:hypothetical protein